MSISNGLSGVIATGGPLTASTAQWDAITGQVGGLTPNTRYYLDPTTAGKLTITAPITAGQVARVDRRRGLDADPAHQHRAHGASVVKNFDRTSSLIKHALLALFCFGALAVTVVQLTSSAGHRVDEGDQDREAQGVARKPLVIIAGQTQTIPTADFLSSPGGASLNGTPATGAGDLEATTINGATIGTGNVSTGTLTSHKVPVANGATSIINSSIGDDGTNVTISTHVTVVEGTGAIATDSTLTTGASITLTAGNVLINNGGFDAKTNGAIEGNLIVGPVGTKLQTANSMASSYERELRPALSADASNWTGRITGIGSNTSTTLTFSGGGFPTSAHCFVQTISGSYIGEGYNVMS